MTEGQKKIWEAKQLSRTWRIAIYGMILLPLALVSQIVLAILGSNVELPLAVIAGMTTAVLTGYMGKRAAQELSKKGTNHGG